jgi:hypothetical protein
VAGQPWPKKIRTAGLREHGKTDHALRGYNVTKLQGYNVKTGAGEMDRVGQATIVPGFKRRAFDQGLGRSFWFVNGGNPAWIEKTISLFPKERRRDLWSGIGLAAVYAGGVEARALEELLRAADEFRPELAQGACFAAKARERAGNLTEYTETATQALCGVSAVEAARLTDSTLENLPAIGNAGEPGYEVWRRRIQGRFGGEARSSVAEVKGDVAVGNS